MPKIEHISATGLESYVSCPYKYYLKYIKNLGDKVTPTEHMIFGIMIHKILEEFNEYIAKEKLPEDPIELGKDLYTKAQQLTAANIFKTRSQHNNLFIRLGMSGDYIFQYYIKPYYDYVLQNQFYRRRLEPEKRFDITIGELAQGFNIEQLNPHYSEYKDLIVTGKIDLIIYPNLIIDFKTQSSAASLKELRNSFQTKLYTLLFDKDMIFQYIYLYRKPVIKTLDILQKDRLNTLNNLIDLIYKLETTHTFNKNPKACYMCLFKKFCWNK